MVFGVIEWFVLVFVILAIIKIIVVSFNPKEWFKFAKSLYKNGAVLFIVELILAAVLFYFLLAELSLVHIMAVIVLGALLTGMTFALYNKETIDWAGKILKGKTLWNKAWLPLLIWLALSIWVLVELF
ncbi:MAG TPA: hypothetical protein VMV95_00360 [Bacillota bacterium]|nr:hypothetical protein [Bacillota bacterium]